MKKLISVITCFILLSSCKGGGGSSGKSSNDGWVSSPNSPNTPTDNPSSSSDSNNTEGFKLSWEPPTTREDSSKLFEYELESYKIMWRKVGGQLHKEDLWKEILIPSNFTFETQHYEINDLEGSGEYEMAIKTIDINGLESSPSNIVRATR
jgi:hypothetical protein